jgi:phosphoribosylanthranilate isomerase
MHIVKVKICGITTYEDAMAAIGAGADLLGFNFFPDSPRYVTIEQAADIVKQLPAFASLVGVFVNAPLETVHLAMDLCHLDWVQLHGDENPEYCRSLLSDNVKIMKALRVKNQEDVIRAHEFATDAILLDAHAGDAFGGTGVAFDWNLVQHTGKRVFLAGGINPDNAVQAVEMGVYGLDICSGVEAEPGRKDHDKMQALFENIRHYRG